MLTCCRKTSKPLVLARTQMCKRPTTEQNPNEHFLALACRQIRKERPIDFFFIPPLNFFYLDLSPTKCNASSKDCQIMGFFFLIFLFLGVGRGVQISLVWGAEGLSRLSWWQASFRELISFSKQNVNLRWGGKGTAISRPLIPTWSCFL